MEHTEQEKAEFREQFSRRRRRQWIAMIPVLAAIITLSALDERARHATGGGSPPVIVGALLGVVILTAGFALRNWRCPACDGYLGRGFNPRFCSRCGTRLR